MRSFLIFLAGFVLGAALLLGGSWINSNQEPAPAEAEASFPDQFFRSASSLGSAESWPNQRKQGLLRQAAAYRQSKDVASSGIYWAEFRKSLTDVGDKDENLGSRSVEMLTNLVDFQDQLEESLASAPNVASFERAWATWLDVQEEIAKAREAVVISLAQARTKVELPAGNSLADIIEQFRLTREYIRANQAGIKAVLATTPPAQPLPEPIVEIGRMAECVQSVSITALKNTQSEIDVYRKQLAEASNKVNPVTATGEEVSQGKMTNYLSDLARLANASTESELAPWLTLRDDENSSAIASKDEKPASVRGYKLDDAIIAAQQDANRGRQLAYNLWALREIHASETVDSWSARLGQIDTGMLEPEVSALYSSTYGKRLEEIKEPERRSSTVQTLLSSPKIALNAF